MTITNDHRYSSDHPCPICGRFATGPKPHCHGICTDDGFARCTNDDGGGLAERDERCTPPAYKWKRQDNDTYRPWTTTPPLGPVRVNKSREGAHGADAKGSANDGAALGGTSAKRGGAPTGRIVATYDYRDEGGATLFQAVRYADPKDFRQRRPNGRGGWVWNLHAVRLVPYRLPELLAADLAQPVFLPEGEKDADALAALGLVATTNAMGAGNWRDDYTPFCAGRHVIVLPDNDKAGRDGAEKVARSLSGTAASVSVLALPGLPDGGDVSDWLAAGGDPLALLALAATTPEWVLPDNPAETPGTAAGDSEAPLAAGPYVVEGGRICWRKPANGGGTVLVPLCNFVAAITEEVISDDGAEAQGDLTISGTLASSTALPTVRVSLTQFPAMNWPTPLWGTRAVVSAGIGAKDRLREAIQLLSPDVSRRVEYAHAGWREVGGQWMYLHAGGAIAAGGVVPDIAVSLTGSLARAALPIPPTGNALVAAIRAALSLLDLAPLPVVAPLLGAAYRAPLNPARLADIALALIGPTGVRKSELAALAQQHTGAGFDRLHLPAAWSATPNALERLLFVAKDIPVVIDDFAPTGTAMEQAKLHAAADRVIRGAGNGTGRGRMRADGGLRPDYPPRGLAIITGEEAPRGQSLKGRMVIVEVSPGDVALDRLTAAQRHGMNGILAAAFAGYVRWLANRMDGLIATARDDLATLRDAARTHTAHARTPENVANLAYGWQQWLAYAEDAGAITGEERATLWERLWDALSTTANAQREHQSDEPARRFLDYVLAAVQSGEAHIAGLSGEEPGSETGDGVGERWGWRVREREAHDAETDGDAVRIAFPQGKCIGWLDRERDALYLQPDAAYAAAQRIAATTGAALPVSVRTLGKRLHERGLLAQTGGQGEYTVQRVVAGRKTRVLYLSPDALLPESSVTSGTSHDFARGDTANTVTDGTSVTETGGTYPAHPGGGASGIPDAPHAFSGTAGAPVTEKPHGEGRNVNVPDVPDDHETATSNDRRGEQYSVAQARTWLDHAARRGDLAAIPQGILMFGAARGVRRWHDESPAQYVLRLRAALWGVAA